MYFTAESLATNRRLQGHWSELWANRDIYNARHDMMVNAYRTRMTHEMLASVALHVNSGPKLTARLSRCAIRKLAWRSSMT